MRDAPDTLMLYAAGFGTRMGALTADRPKPLVEVAGRPLIDHTLDVVGAADITKTVINLHYRADQMIEHLRTRDVTLTHETPDILETGGGLRAALPHLGEGPVFTMNSDAIWTGANPLAQLRAAWDPDRMDALLLLVPSAQATGHQGAGDFAFAEGGHLTRGAGHVYTGAQILRTDGLSTIPERVFSLNLLWDSMLLDERVFGVIHQGGWCDVGQPESIPLAEALLQGANV